MHFQIVCQRYHLLRKYLWTVTSKSGIQIDRGDWHRDEATGSSPSLLCGSILSPVSRTRHSLNSIRAHTITHWVCVCAGGYVWEREAGMERNDWSIASFFPQGMESYLQPPNKYREKSNYKLKNMRIIPINKTWHVYISITIIWLWCVSNNIHIQNKMF